MTVTDAAAERAASLLQRTGKPAGGLRVRVLSAGCEGFVAVLDLADDPESAEIEWTEAGVRFFTDVASMLQLPGATLDYVKTDHGAEFVWSHPAATGVCGCADHAHEHVGDNASVTSATT
jgi:iron-sulfur cluster assembly accessory protein